MSESFNLMSAGGEMSDEKKTKEEFVQEQTSEARREQAEKALLESEEKYRTILENIEEGYYEVDLAGNLTFFNDALCGLYGYTRDELMGMNYRRYVDAEATKTMYRAYNAVYRTGKPDKAFDWDVIRKDGAHRFVEVSISLIRDPTGEPVGFRGIIRDITERKRAEAMLERAYAEVEKQVEERTVELQREIIERKRAQAESLRLQEEVIEAQKRALQELSTPIIPVMDRIIVMPLIGSIDSLRARDITRSLLAGISEQRAKVVILDITGVPMVDSRVASHLNKTIQAARLKGARIIVTGISDAVAETIVDLGIDWVGVETVADLQTGLIVALQGLGIKLTKQ
jgi:PAS domain S-box-containing protein